MKFLIFGLACYALGVILGYNEYFGHPTLFGIIVGVTIGLTAVLMSSTQ